MLKTLRLHELCGFAFNPKSASVFIYINAKFAKKQRNFLIFRRDLIKRLFTLNNDCLVHNNYFSLSLSNDFQQNNPGRTLVKAANQQS